jgi:hypothetical protein
MFDPMFRLAVFCEELLALFVVVETVEDKHRDFAKPRLRGFIGGGALLRAVSQCASVGPMPKLSEGKFALGGLDAITAFNGLWGKSGLDGRGPSAPPGYESAFHASRDLPAPMPNALYYGDNLTVLRESIPDESVDLIYLDPPFNSNASYNVLFKAPSGEQSQAQIEAFEDTWHWNESAERAFDEVVTGPHSDAAIMLRAMRSALGENDMMAYLAMMAVRLIELHRVLKPTGSLYLHCDPTASHYLKILLDSVFGPTLFRNEIIWQRTTPKGHAFTRFPSTHDILLAYGRGEETTWHGQYGAHREQYIESHYSNVEPGTGRRYRLDNCLNPNQTDQI